MARFQAGEPNGVAVQHLEVLVRAAVFKSANALVEFLLQGAADQIDATYQPKPGQHYKGRVRLQVEGMFGSFALERDYYYHEGKQQGHYPADAGLGLETGHTPALTRLMCLEGADETSYQKAEQLIAQARQECTGKAQASAVEKELGYFASNIARMQYGTFRRKGFFIGSGVIEAGGKTVIGSRCKQSGMFWGEPGAENVLALRCIHSSRRLGEFWKHRLNAHAARNDSLALAA